MQIGHYNVLVLYKIVANLPKYACNTIVICGMCWPCLNINPVVASICPHIVECISRCWWWVRINHHVKVYCHSICHLCPNMIQQPPCKCWNFLCQMRWPHNGLTPTSLCIANALNSLWSSYNWDLVSFHILRAQPKVFHHTLNISFHSTFHWIVIPTTSTFHSTIIPTTNTFHSIITPTN